MNLAVGSLTFLGLILLVAGVVSKVISISVFAPYFASFSSYFLAANTCLIMALVVDKFQKT